MSEEVQYFVDQALDYFNQKHHCSIYELYVFEKPDAVRVANILRSHGFVIKIDPFGYRHRLTVSKSKNIIVK
jgi:hypothetical protein